jgi:hypothetical protein
VADRVSSPIQAEKHWFHIEMHRAANCGQLESGSLERRRSLSCLAERLNFPQRG